MSKQHTWDYENEDQNHAGCLNRHIGRYSDNNECSHRWQAKLRGLDDKKRYTWPTYEPGPRMLGAYDITTQGNFEKSSRKPWVHEAHHIVPQGELHAAIRRVGAGHSREFEITQKIRNGLRRAEYKLNSKRNMVLLPLTRRPSKVLGLPRHKRTPTTPHHRDYSLLVEKRITPLFDDFRASGSRCDPLKTFKIAKKLLEEVSDDLYELIMSSEARSIDVLARRELRDEMRGMSENLAP